MKIYNELVSETQLRGDALAREISIIAAGRSGDLFMAKGDLQRAYGYYLDSRFSAEHLVEAEETAVAWLHLSTAQRKEGSYYIAEGMLGNAEEAYGKAYQAAETVCRFGRTPEAVENLLVCCRKLGEVLCAFGEPDKAEPHYRAAVQLAKELESLGAMGAQTSLAESYLALAEGMYACFDTEKGEKYVGLALDYAEAACRENVTFSSRSLLALCSEKQAELYEKQGEKKLASLQYLVAKSLYEELAGEAVTLRVNRSLIRCYLGLARSRERGEKSDALEYLLQAHILAQAIYRENQMLETRLDLSGCKVALGDFYMEEGNAEQARSNYLSAVEILKDVKREADIPAHADKLAVVYAKVAGTYRGMKRQLWLRRARHLEKKLIWRCPNVPAYRKMLESIDRSLGIKGGFSIKNVAILALGTAGLFASEYRYNYLDIPADLSYWLLGGLGCLLSVFGAYRIFETSIMNEYQKKAQKKRREKRDDYFTAVCNMIARILFVIVLLMLARVVLLEWLSK